MNHRETILSALGIFAVALVARVYFAAQIVFLCSPAARYITGQALVADGGLVLANWNTNITPGMDW